MVRRNPLSRLLLPLGSLLALALIFEGVMRTCLFVGGFDRLSNPGAYADPNCHDDYWLLVRRASGWGPPPRAHPESERDQALGWTVDRRNQNPVGGWESPPWKGEEAPRLALFGDSFVFGTTPNGERLPDYLQEELPDLQVLNYGVSGYGFDQILLHLESRSTEMKDAKVIIGVLTNDLDRSVLTVRSGPKPYFLLQDGVLELQDEHLRGEAWYETGPPAIRSYLLSWLRLNIPREMETRIHHRDWSCRTEEKNLLAKALMARMAGFCRAESLDCSLLVFLDPEEWIEPPGWRETLLVNEARRLEIPVLNTRTLLAQSGMRSDQLYGHDRHLTAAANQALAREIAASVVGEEP